MGNPNPPKGAGEAHLATTRWDVYTCSELEEGQMITSGTWSKSGNGVSVYIVHPGREMEMRQGSRGYHFPVHFKGAIKADDILGLLVKLN